MRSDLLENRTLMSANSFSDYIHYELASYIQPIINFHSFIFRYLNIIACYCEGHNDLLNTILGDIQPLCI